MIGLSTISISKAHQIIASLPNHQISPSPPRKPTPRSINRKTDAAPPSSPQQPHRSKPSVAEIERAIGAGIFWDRDPTRDPGQEKNLFDSIFSTTVGRTEGPVEKKLRETGEWLCDLTENKSRNAGKTILVVLFLWFLPVWMLSMLVASGIVELPFSDEFINNLIM